MSWIDNTGILASLHEKLEYGQLEAFLHEVQAQSGEHIRAEAVPYLLRDAEYILRTLEMQA